MKLFKNPPRLKTPWFFGASPEKARMSLRELSFANRFYGGTRSVLTSLAPLLTDHSQEVRILDVGTGSADIPRAVVRWGRKLGIHLQVVALDRHPEAVATAAATSKAFTEIQLVQSDVFGLPFRSRSFDFVTASMLLHYFPFKVVLQLLQEFASIAKQAVLVADIERHWFPCRAIDWISRLSRNRLIRKDFCQTVLRGFTYEEMEILAGKAGFVRWHIRRYFPFRLVLVGYVT
ncbi:MAG: methyltransferase domain-containing protein [Candidatus Brocadia sp.]